MTMFKKKLIAKISPLHSLKPFPMSNIGGNVTRRDIIGLSLWNLAQEPLRWPLLMPSRKKYTMLEIMITSTWDGLLYIKRETKWCQSTSIYSIPCAQMWESETPSETWLWSITVAYTSMSKQRWIYWTYPRWELLIDMQSKSRKGISRSSVLPI